MQSIQERIIENIRLDVKQFLRNDIQLQKRDEKWDKITESILKEEIVVYKLEQEENHRKQYEKLNKEMKKNFISREISYEEWIQKCSQLYEINEQCEVVSFARGDDTKKWECSCNWEAKNKILQLIRYMYYDHFKRENNGGRNRTQDFFVNKIDADLKEIKLKAGIL